MRGTPWTRHQSITGQHRDTQDTPIHTNLERPINLTVMFWDCEQKPEYQERTHACTGRTCKLHAERPPAGSQTQDLLAAKQQCYQMRHHALLFYFFHICFLFSRYYYSFLLYAQLLYFCMKFTHLDQK
ncbi:hypothetical protein GOODEAATRI_027268 [Goodea atripinnis]|uniref:Uncharacterized protein n=1 Tax=Goodea atripinnis TaxID=208336 RepID=A0ABV0NNN8_9TELE